MKPFEERRSSFMRRLARILETGDAELTPEWPLTDENWDSLTIMSTIALIDEQFGVTVPGDQLAACKSVSELMVLVEKALT